jgi:uncharacterized protein YdeI (YjbR/CyaY-like superfamily)
MPSFDPRVDAFIAKSAPFAQPILEHLRQLVHEVCPDVEETIKWGMPALEYKGPMCGFAAFKAHCTFGFWKASLMQDVHGVMSNEATAWGHLGRITSLQDLPSDAILKSLIQEAMRLNDEGIKVPTAARKKGVIKNEIAEPEYVTALLKKHKAARETWEKFAPSHRKEYLEWITEAKTDATREKRLQKMIEQLNEGKSRHWKYQ